MNNPLIKEMASIRAINEEALELYYPKVRDRDDIQVLRDPISAVIVLSKTSHVEDNYYREKPETGRYTSQWSQTQTPKLFDNVRRAQDCRWYIQDKVWLDFGCGLGGALEELGPYAGTAFGLEPAQDRLERASQLGYTIYSSLDEIADNSLDVVTLFHVLEHIPGQLEVLKEIKAKLKSGGKLIVEVPHARDAMLSQFDHAAFKAFTFWSEHLILHTRMSLTRVLDCAGFTDTHVSGLQRYPLANHLYWLATDKPGGHNHWRSFSSPQLEAEYTHLLCSQDKTDSLFAISQKP